MSEQDKGYNGQLRALYLDLDKRLALMENNFRLSWDTHDKEAKEHREYVHRKFHDIMEVLITVKDKVTKLPCEYRVERDKERRGYIDKQIQALWSVVILIIGGVLATAWKVLFNH